jgi:prepilin-type N-terminal cleavage/methylation domain-containing protein
MKKAKKGFTLVELIVAIAILSILATVAVVGYTGYVNKAKDAKAEMELSQIVAYINAELADDEWKVGDYTVKMSTDGKITVDGTQNFADVIKACSDLNNFSQNITTSANDGVIIITYTSDEGGSATAQLN